MKKFRQVLQILLGSVLIYTGIQHLTSSRQEFQAQVPSWTPFSPDFIVLASGIVEIILGLALVSLQRRREVGIATALFFVAIFPGNISQFVNGIDAFGLNSDRARAIRLLFQPLLVLWALWSTTALPEGSLRKILLLSRETFSRNKFAAFVGFLTGGVGTRFLEDGNLLITSVLTLVSTTTTLLIWVRLKKLKNSYKN